MARTQSGGRLLTLVGMAAGAAIGAGIALVYAPNNGEKNRQQLQEWTQARVSDAQTRAQARISETQNRLQAKAQNAQTQVQATVEKAQAQVQTRVEDIQTKLEDRVMG